MIELTKESGDKLVVNPNYIAAFEEAGLSQKWHGVKANVQLATDNRWYGVRETVGEIAAKISKAL